MVVWGRVGVVVCMHVRLRMWVRCNDTAAVGQDGVLWRVGNVLLRLAGLVMGRHCVAVAGVCGRGTSECEIRSWAVRQHECATGGSRG